MYALIRMASDCTADIGMDADRFNTWATAFPTWSSTLSNNISTITNDTPEPTIKALEDTVSKTTACLEEKINSNNNLSSDILRDYDTYSLLNKQLTDAQAQVQISKDRVGMLTTPEQKTTVYESWFPLRRPLQTSSFLLLLVFGLFFITIFFGLLLSQGGIFVDIGIISFIPPGQVSAALRQITPITLIFGLALIGCIIYLARKR
jgi:hypothetical protein